MFSFSFICGNSNKHFINLAFKILEDGGNPVAKGISLTVTLQN